MNKSSFSFPVDLGNGLVPSDDNVSLYYRHTEEDHPGGYFPVGANTMWHGGVHLHAQLRTPVHAMASGKIVAVRLAEEERANQYYGSNNFILLSHDLGDKTYYSLYLHLHWEQLESNNKKITDIPWLKDKNGQPEEEILKKLKTGDVCLLDVPVKAGDKIWTLGEYGSNKIMNYRASMIHWEVFSEKEIPGRWRFVEDTNTDVQCDSQEIVNYIDQSESTILGNMLKPDGSLDKDELVEFYKKPSKNRDLLRFYQCKFISEYGVNWDSAVKKLEDRFITVGLAERLSKYTFWDEAKSVLPSNNIVWHYNPIAFIEQASIDKDVFMVHEVDLMIGENEFIAGIVNDDDNTPPPEYAGNYCLRAADRALSKLLGDTKNFYSLNREHERLNSVGFSGKGAKDRGKEIEKMGYTKSHFVFKDYQIDHNLRVKTKSEDDYYDNRYDVVTLQKGSALFDYLNGEIKARKGYHVFYMSVSDDFHTLLLVVHIVSDGDSTYTIIDQHGETSSSGKFSDIEKGIARQSSWTFLYMYMVKFKFNPDLHGGLTTRLWKIQRK